VDAVGCCELPLAGLISNDLPQERSIININGSFQVNPRMIYGDEALVSAMYSLSNWNGMATTLDLNEVTFTFLNATTNDRGDTFTAFIWNNSSNAFTVYETTNSFLLTNFFVGLDMIVFNGNVQSTATYNPTPGNGESGLIINSCGPVSIETFQKVERLMNTMFPSE